MVETYKYKSKIATAIAFIAALISYLGKDGLTQIMPAEYAFLIPILVFAAGYVLAQTTENKRVEIAEQMIHEKYENNNNIIVDPTVNIDPEEDAVGDSDGC